MNESKMSIIQIKVPADLKQDFNDYAESQFGMTANQAAQSVVMQMMNKRQLNLSSDGIGKDEIPDKIAHEIYLAEHDPKWSKSYSVEDGLKLLHRMRAKKADPIE